MQDKLKKITYDYIVIDSEYFYGLGYAVLKGEMSILAGKNGRMDLSLESVPELCKELMDIYEVYSDNTNNMANPLKEDQSHSKRCTRARTQKKVG